MHMVMVSPYFEETNLIALADLYTYFFQLAVNRRSKYGPPILGRTNYVIEQD